MLCPHVLEARRRRRLTTYWLYSHSVFHNQISGNPENNGNLGIPSEQFKKLCQILQIMPENTDGH